MCYLSFSMRLVVSALLCLIAATADADAPVELMPEPELTAANFAVVEIVPRNAAHWDVGVFARPDRRAPLAGHVARGARIRIRGQVAVPDARGCHSDLYYALEPFGYICGDDAEPSDQGPATGQILELVEGSPLPYTYAMVNVPEGEFVPLWDSLSDIVNYEPAKRMLGRGDTVAVEPKTMRVEGERYRVTIDGDLVAAEHSYKLRRFSQWQGTTIDANTHLPFGWATRRKVPVYDAPKGKKVGHVLRRERVDIYEEQVVDKKRWIRIGEGQFVRAAHVNEVRPMARPEGTGQLPQWFDVDLGEQVVIAYRGDLPAYATLISSGRPPNRTPRGNYPVWGKASAVTMKSQPYDDKPYHVHRVPWVLFFQAHNALHGAYWHDRFGVMKSHGCVNMSPKDARYLFEWVEPKLPPGWTALHFWELSRAPVVHVRNSLYPTPFRQERDVGPPDPEEEAERLAKAEARRERERQEQLSQQVSGDANSSPAQPAGQKSPAQGTGQKSPAQGTGQTPVPRPAATPVTPTVRGTTPKQRAGAAPQ